jgi:hypothetical protein
MFSGAAVVAAVLAAGAATSANAPSGIRGTLVPCGLIHERAAPCAGGVAGATVRVRDGAGNLVATAKADRRGRFRLVLREGAYSVRARVPGAHAGPALAVLVPAHEWVNIVLTAGRTAPQRSLEVQRLR